MSYTIYDIAKLAKVSRSTVSRVLNNDPRVSFETRQIVKNAIAATSYKPSLAARGLSKGKIDVIAFILGDIRNPFFSDIAYHIQLYMKKAGYLVLLINSGFDPSAEISSISTAQKFGFAGIFLIPSSTDSEVVNNLRSEECPLVLVQRNIRDYQGDVVIQDDFRAGYILAQYLIQSGHNRIAVLHGPNTSNSSILRLSGIRCAAENAAISLEPEFLYEGDYTMKTGYEVGMAYLSQLDKAPQAVICGNDLMAIGFIEACKKQNVSVPETISIASFDDIEFASLESIQLTTIHHPIEKMCKKACEIMIARISGTATSASKVTLKPTLMIRKTTAPPAKL